MTTSKGIMKKILFALLLCFSISLGSSLEAEGAACSTITGASCVTGACPSDSNPVDGTCSSNGTCCQKKSAATGTGLTSAQCQAQGGSCNPFSCPTGKIDSGHCISGTSTSVRCCTTAGANGTGQNSTGSTDAVSITVANPLKYDTVEGVLTSIMGGIKGIVVTLALIMIVIGGVMYIFSAGNDGRMKVAKNIVLAALIGLAIVIAAPAFLREISGLLGWDSAPAIEGGTNLTLTQIAGNVLKFLLSIIGVLALIMMMISGIMYFASGGNEARVKQAKNIFVASLIGILVAMGSLVLVTAVSRFFI